MHNISNKFTQKSRWFTIWSLIKIIIGYAQNNLFLYSVALVLNYIVINPGMISFSVALDYL